MPNVLLQDPQTIIVYWCPRCRSIIHKKGVVFDPTNKEHFHARVWMVRGKRSHVERHKVNPRRIKRVEVLGYAS